MRLDLYKKPVDYANKTPVSSQRHETMTQARVLGPFLTARKTSATNSKDFKHYTYIIDRHN